MARESMTVKTADGSFDCYVARPAGDAPAPAIVVIQEIFGVNRFVRAVADRLAGMGYLAVAPDLFWRIEPGVDITDQSEAEWKKAFELYQAFNVDKGIDDIGATIDLVRQEPGCNGKVGAVGYCLGGLLAYLTATRTSSDASVSYYGVGIDNFLGEADRARKPLLLHIAEKDQFVPKEAQDKVVAALKDRPGVEVYTYPGCDHAFAREQGQHYDAQAAETANRRTADFFQRALG